MRLLKENCVEPPDDPVLLSQAGVLGAWSAVEDIGNGIRLFRATPRFVTAEQICASRVLTELAEAGRSPIDQFVGALEADSIVALRLDQTMVSSGAGGTIWQAAGIARGFVHAAIEAAPAFELDAPTRTALVDAWISDLRRTVDRQTVVVALEDFEVARTAGQPRGRC
jgi:hypothetical protein